MALIPIRPNVYTQLGCPTRFGPEKASSAWKEGALLIYTDDASTLEEAGDDPTQVSLAGIALHDATGVTNARAFFVPPLPGNMQFDASVDTSASEGTGTTTNVVIGETYTLTKTSQAAPNAGKWYVDLNEGAAATDIVRVVDIIDAATIQGRVRFEFLSYAPSGA